VSFYVPTHFVESYSTNVAMLLQAQGGKLSGCVTTGSYVGQAASPTDQIGFVKAEKKVSRHDDTPLISTPSDRRWVEPVDYRWADLIDSQDRLRMLIDPTSAYTMNGVNALRRSQDDEILYAFYSLAKTGQKTTTGTTAYATANTVGPTVGSTGNTGLNVAKLKRARQGFRSRHVDLEGEDMYILLTSNEEEDLLAETQVINLDYNSNPVLMDGRLTRFLGFQIKFMEFTNAAFYDSAVLMSDQLATPINYVPMWAKSGMHLGIWNDVMVRVGERPDKDYSTQVYVRGTYGATRLEEGKVTRVDCYTG
jgi:Phage capsid protein